MAKKNSSEGFLDKLLNVLVTGKSLISTTVDDLERRVERVTEKVIKASVQYLIFLVGILFVLVGLANYLQGKYVWMDGVGFLVVGGALVVLVVFVRAFQK